MDDVKTEGQVAYEAFYKTSKGVDRNGHTMCKWDELTDSARSGWDSMASGIAQAKDTTVEDLTRFLMYGGLMSLGLKSLRFDGERGVFMLWDSAHIAFVDGRGVIPDEYIYADAISALASILNG